MVLEKYIVQKFWKLCCHLVTFHSLLWLRHSSLKYHQCKHSRWMLQPGSWRSSNWRYIRINRHIYGAWWSLFWTGKPLKMLKWSSLVSVPQQLFLHRPSWAPLCKSVLRWAGCSHLHPCTYMNHVWSLGLDSGRPQKYSLKVLFTEEIWRLLAVGFC